MGTGIFERCKLAILKTIKNDIFAEHRYGCQVSSDFVIPGGDVPSILEKHFLPRSRFNRISIFLVAMRNKRIFVAFLFRKT